MFRLRIILVSFVCLATLFGVSMTGTATAADRIVQQTAPQANAELSVITPQQELTPEMRQCVERFWWDLFALDYRVAWRAIETCFKGEMQVARDWLRQACVNFPPLNRGLCARIQPPAGGQPPGGGGQPPGCRPPWGCITGPIGQPPSGGGGGRGGWGGQPPRH